MNPRRESAASGIPGTRKAYGIVPPTGLYVREDRCQTPVGKLKTITLRPPIDLLYAGGAFEAAGAETRLADYPAENRGWADLERELAAFRPDLLLLSCTTQTLAADVEAAALAKRVWPDTLTAAKGAHFNVHDVESLAAAPTLDVVIRGEIEETCIELAAGRPLAEIAGITWRAADGRVVRNPDRPFPTDLDRLPLPARHLLDNRGYTRPDTGAPQTSVVTNRGCPYHCTYCLANQIAGLGNRYRSVPDVLRELRECVVRHGLTSFLFRSDLFTQNRDWVLALCRAIVEEDLAIEWACNARVDSVDAEMLAAMRRAGCWIVAFGVESGDQQVLDRLEKRSRVADAHRAVALCRAAGIKSSVYLLMGFPWETHASVAALSRFARDLDPDILEVFFPYPFPGTALRQQMIDEGLLADGTFPTESYDTPAVPSHRLDVAELRRLRKRLLRDFYVRPAKIARTLWATRSPTELGNYVRVGLQQMRELVSPG
jgi:anaerobic magnesium-protoporphyrin IX monomethyl ester cyclase